MKIIKMLDHDIKLRIEDSNGWSENLGRSNYSRGEILILSSMSQDSKCCTLIHELIHIIDRINDVSLTEQKVSIIAVGIHSFIKNNQLLIQSMYKRSK
jgi:hypothetical protein